MSLTAFYGVLFALPLAIIAAAVALAATQRATAGSSTPRPV